MVAATMATACGSKHISGPTRPEQVLVVLLQDSNTGLTGRAQVSNPFGSIELAAERDATLAKVNRRPDPIRTLSEADVKRLFGDALAALPPAPQRFTLYFRFESDELTPVSRALLHDIVSTVKQLSVPDVVVVGHTDTMGAPRANFQLGLKRATAVRGLLANAGLDISSIDVASHGEADLLIQTPNETPEPRNRRVEIAVR
jgi:outer membrane protein OmpA-like peptidoglycan-associated protein